MILLKTFDNKFDFSVFESKARPDQLQGTDMEKLAECAGRICYDSFGTGRSSQDWHEHVLNVRHLSIYEHCWFCIDDNYYSEEEINMEHVSSGGIRFIERPDYPVSSIEFNARFALEHKYDFMLPVLEKYMPNVLKAARAAKLPISDRKTPNYDVGPFGLSDNWATLLLDMSRGCSHEIVRHGDNTAISQRSTRYVDESKPSDEELGCEPKALSSCPSNCVLIPPFSFDDPTLAENINSILEDNFKSCMENYLKLKQLFKEYNESNNNSNSNSKTFTTKVVNGLARLVLPHNLRTEMVFSAEREQWKHMINMRTSPGADQEIRRLFSEIQKVLDRNFSS